MPGDRPPVEPGTEPRIAATTGRAAGFGTAAAISLNEAAKQISVAEQIALGDHQLRRWMTYWTIGAFIGANAVTLAALGALVWLDQSNIASHLITPGERIITNQVFMSLLGATTVQVGAVAYVIAQYLFPSRSPRA